MGIGRVRDNDCGEQLVSYESSQRLELWVRTTGLLDRFCVYLGGALLEGLDDGRIHVFPIDRQPEVSAVIVRFNGQQGGLTSIVDVSGAARKVQQRHDHSYLVRAV